MEVSPVECKGRRYCSSKVPKLEGMPLHALLLDDPPSLDVASGDLGLHSIRTMFEVFNNAAAMCEAAHLASLKSYTAKFMSYLTHKYDTDSGLRPPTFLEAQSADKQVHTVIFELVSERGWSIDQALHEMTSVRADLPIVLQPRPRPVKPVHAPYNPKGPPKGARAILEKARARKASPTLWSGSLRLTSKATRSSCV